MRACTRLAIALVMLMLVSADAMAAEGVASLVLAPDNSMSSWSRTPDGGLAAKIIGQFQVKYEGYEITGSKGEFFQPPQGKQNATTRLKAIVTENARLAQSGADHLELTAGDMLEIDLESEGIIASGGITVKSKQTTITASELKGGQLATMRTLIENALQEIGPEHRAIVEAWFADCQPTDRLLLIEGNVKATDPSFVFHGARIVVNSTTENYLFLGPHTLEMQLD